MPENIKNSFLPTFRRSTYRAPDPASADTFDLAPPAAASADPAEVETSTGATSTHGAFAPASRHPRHRADRAGNRRPSSGTRRALLLGGASALLGGALVATIAVAGVDQDAALAAAGDREAAIQAAASGGAASDDLVSQVDASRPVVTGGLSAEAAPFTGGTQVTVEGRNLDEVAAVTVAGAPAEIVAETPVAVTFAVPAVDDAFRGEAEIELTDAAGTPIDVETPAAPSSPAAAAADLIGPVADATAAAADAAAEAATATAEPLTITYTSDPGIDAQIAYVLAHWSSYNSAQYPVLGGVDCANFASQSLIARGWAMDGAWYYDAGTRQMSPAWSSSTALRDYLLTQPGRATALTDAQRDQVKVGDLAQFDWDHSGDRDHTAIVTRVEHTDDGTKVWVGGHTKDADYWDVDQALANSGGSVSYFSLS
ncbi:amidase domain-containing protein [Agromyces sp. NPDC056523]|uniref:amidase domain-containing protein n=1 Tax=Agromyces sp. NPDC056523 TaxID=3345850 RepID=UPI00367194AA